MLTLQYCCGNLHQREREKEKVPPPIRWKCISSLRRKIGPPVWGTPKALPGPDLAVVRLGSKMRLPGVKQEAQQTIRKSAAC